MTEILNPLVTTMFSELRELRDQAPLEATADIDMVWGVSAPGTITENANGAYAGKSFDALVISRGIDLVREVTARRMGKDVATVTKEDIEAHGPTFYYNGENKDIPGYTYAQNEDLAEAASDENFPIPESKIVLGHISAAHTPAQVKDIAEYIRTSAEPINKVAVVSLGAHSVRVSRYLELSKELFPEEVKLVQAPVSLEHDTPATVHREVNKVLQYLEKGHLATKSYFADK